jgi:hypothetical protein
MIELHFQHVEGYSLLPENLSFLQQMLPQQLDRWFFVLWNIFLSVAAPFSVEHNMENRTANYNWRLRLDLNQRCEFD